MTNQDDTTPSYDPTLTNTSSLRPAGGTPHSRPTGEESTPTQIGPFKIVGTIGEGGMGTVYEAEQESPKRTVALKVIRAGLASASMLKRFELESQVLGRLQHPGIGQVYQAGTADTESGRHPYFAMEYVRGVDLRKHVNQKNPGTRERLDLLAKICDAVHHAHQKGVIHRDLKPGNILVDESGQPKILDFGVARATDSDMQVTTMQTDVGQLIGTLQYMSPEQVAADPNDLDTRSDVYALGVIAYEMLTGQAPYNLKNKMIHEVARIIREDEPTALSATSRVFRGDIETIVIKAMEKDKERRYQSAAGLAEDVRRYLKDEPILARPQSAMYQLQKFAMRNKALASGLLVAMTALIIGIVTSTYLYVQAETARQGETQQRILAQEREAEAVTARSAEEEQRKLAEQREEEAIKARAETQARADELKTVTEFQKSMLGEIDPEAMGRGIVTAQREDIREQMESEGAEAADVEIALASFDELVAKTNATNLALKVVDENVLARAVATINEEFVDQPVTQASLQQTVANTYRKIGLYESAMPLQEQALKTRRQELGDDHPATLTSIGNMGVLLVSMGKNEEALPFLREALESRRRVLGDDHRSTLSSINNMGHLLQAMGKLKEAEPYYRENLEGSRRVLGDNHPSTLTSIGNMGVLLVSMGKFEEAEPYFREALEDRRRVLGDDHPNTLASINNMGALLKKMGKLEEAEPYYREDLEGSRRVLGDSHPSTLTSIDNMGGLLRSMGKLGEAEPYLREALEGTRRVLGNDHPDTLISIDNMGGLLRRMGKLKEAGLFYREAMEGKRRVLGDGHPDTLTTIGNMGLLMSKLGRHDEGVDLLLEAHQLLAEGFGGDHKRTIGCIKLLIKLYDAWHTAEPGKGYDTKAAEWRGKITAEEKSK